MYLERFRSLSPAKRSTNLLKCTFYIRIAKQKWAMFFIKLMPFLMKKDSNTTLVPNENENTFNALSNDPIFYLLSLKIIGKISHSKVRLFSRGLATLKEALSVRPSVGLLVRW